MLAPAGEYRGDLVVQKHKYMVAGGSHDYHYLVKPDRKNAPRPANAQQVTHRDRSRRHRAAPTPPRRHPFILRRRPSMQSEVRGASRNGTPHPFPRLPQAHSAPLLFVGNDFAETDIAPAVGL